ncbi:lipase, putative [Vibrio mediterranei AK1]|uniref:VolA/Pla-1 family phospholipase n=1 Tax=Vibrio mediterranei TaxID=689 RepID=UPI0001541936|nr:VolA/Pla-1 family phospholipase [Vibrio mediterranei]EDL53544.1 lipase, putative [Vibrio mediterranei AK1]
MKKLPLALTISASLLISACGDEGELVGTPTTPNYEPYIQQSLAQPTKLAFTLQGSNADVPFPTFALMNQTDGTLELPTGGDDSLSNPIAAMGQMDGWSTTSPISVKFGAPLTLSPDPSSVTIIKLTEGLTSASPAPESVLTYGTDFVLSTTGNSLVIALLKALEPSSEYIIAVNDKLLDINGEAVGTSQGYAALKSSSKTYTEGTLASAQKVVQGTEQLIAAGTSNTVNTTNIVYSTWFSTQSVGQTLFATKSMIAATLLPEYSPSDIWKGVANPNNVAIDSLGQMTFGVPEDYAQALASDSNFISYINTEDARNKLIGVYANAGTVTVTKGSVKLPYYLETDANWNSQPFESGSPSLAVINSIISDDDEKANFVAQLVAKGIDPSAFESDPSSQLPKLMGTTFTKLDGSRYDEERIITRYAPVPAVKSLPDVNFLLFTPTSGSISGLVIYQHGITSAKENAYAFAKNFTDAGLALIAIDAPIHGERSLDAQRSANVSVLAYMNLSVLPVARDNIRQSMLDLMTLRYAISANQAAGALASTPLATLPNTTTTQPSFLGHSLGGVLGVPAVAQANAKMGNTADSMFGFSRAAFVNSGGQIANLLFGSGFYGPYITHNIALQGSTGYGSYASANCSGISEAQCLTDFESTSSSNLPALLAENLQFIYATQTVVDTADPYTNADTLIAEGTPVYMAQVKDDGTVPNNVLSAKYVTSSPMAGTEPLATKFSLEVFDSAKGSGSSTSPFVRFRDIGKHSTFISVQDTNNLSDLAYHAEMQSEVVSFLATGSSAISDANSVLE